MTDESIIELYWQREAAAITETDAVYGKYCFSIAYNILASREDSDESVNDTYLAAWNTIPHTRPGNLKAFLGRLTRNISINKLRRDNSQKRGGGETALALEELSECIPAGSDVAGEVEAKELEEQINAFLDTLPKRDRDIFLVRYWYVMPIKDIADRAGIRESHVRQILHRTRKKLMNHLKEAGLQ